MTRTVMLVLLVGVGLFYGCADSDETSATPQPTSAATTSPGATGDQAQCDAQREEAEQWNPEKVEESKWPRPGAEGYAAMAMRYNALAERYEAAGCGDLERVDPQSYER